MITMASFRAAILRSLAQQVAERAEELKRIEAKRQQQEEHKRFVAEERERLRAAEAEKLATLEDRQREWEQRQLDEMAAMIARQTKG